MTQARIWQRLDTLRKQHGTRAKAAAAIGISAQYFSDILNGKRTPGPKVLRALGLKRVTTFVASCLLLAALVWQAAPTTAQSGMQVVNAISGNQFHGEQWVVGFEVNLPPVPQWRDFPLYFYDNGDVSQPITWVDTDVLNVSILCKSCTMVLVSAYDIEGRFLFEPVPMNGDKLYSSGDMQIRRRGMPLVYVRIQSVGSGTVEVQMKGHRPRP